MANIGARREDRSRSIDLTPRSLWRVAIMAGLAGWAIENAISAGAEPRYSKAFRGRRVPFLPVYATGGVGIALAARRWRHLSAPRRFGIYAATAVLAEGFACLIDRAIGGEASWDYGAGACVDWRHTLIWGALGLIVEDAIVVG